MSAPVKTRLELMNYLTEELNLALRNTEYRTNNLGITGLPFAQDFHEVINKILEEEKFNITCKIFLHYLIIQGIDYYGGDEINVTALAINPIGLRIYEIFPGILNAFISSSVNFNKLGEKPLPSPQELIDKLLESKKDNTEVPGEEEDPKKKFLDMIQSILHDASPGNTPPSPFGNLGEGISDEEFAKYGGDDGPVSGRPIDPESSTPILDQFSFDMTLAARTGKYDPVL